MQDDESEDEPVVFRRTVITPKQNQVNCEIMNVSSQRHDGSSQRGVGSSQRLDGSFQKHCGPSKRPSPRTTSRKGQNSTLQKGKVVQGSKTKNLALSLLCSQQAHPLHEMGARHQAVNNVANKFTWRIANFSKLDKTNCCSEVFTLGSYKWILTVFHTGNFSGSSSYLSVYLVAVDPVPVDLPYAKFCLAVVDQINSNNTFRIEFEHKFTAIQNYWGLEKFKQLKDLKTPGEGYIVNDVCIVEAEFTLNSTQDSEEELEPNVVSGEETSEDEQSAGEMTDHSAEPSTRSSNNNICIGSIQSRTTQQNRAHDQVTTTYALGVSNQGPLNRNEHTIKVQQYMHWGVSNQGPLNRTEHTIKVQQHMHWEYPNAGQLFEEGKQQQPDVWFDAEIFEAVGGFTILKTQALLYKQIWLKYGHIATSKILRDSYSAQVTLVSGIMTSLMEMKQSLSVDKMSPEVIESFEFKIKMAEGVEFNVKWLRDWFENVKRDFYVEQKIESALVGQDQCLMAAMKQLNETRDELTKKLSAIETTISTLLSETQMKKRKVSRGLSFDGLF